MTIYGRYTKYSLKCHDHISSAPLLRLYFSLPVSYFTAVPSSVVANQTFYPHPLYNIRLTELLAGKSLHAATGRIGWSYFLHDRKSPLACAEVSSIRGVHKNVRLTEGPFVRTTFELISKSGRDPGLGGGASKYGQSAQNRSTFFVCGLRRPEESSILCQ